MLRRYGFFILLGVMLLSVLIITNITFGASMIVRSGFFDHIEGGTTDADNRIWVLTRQSYGYAAVLFDENERVRFVLRLENPSSNTMLSVGPMMTDRNNNFYIATSVMDSDSGMLTQESVLMLKNDEEQPKEVFRLTYTAAQNVVMPTIKHIAPEGNHIFVTTADVSNIKTYYVSPSSQEAIITDEYLTATDVYINQAVRLDNGTLIFSTKSDVVYGVFDHRHAQILYPRDGRSAVIRNLQAVRGDRILFTDVVAGSLIDMAYIDFDKNVRMTRDDTFEGPYGDVRAEQFVSVYPSGNGDVIAVFSQKTEPMLFYGNLNSLRTIRLLFDVRRARTSLIISNIIAFFAAMSLSIVLWQIYLFIDVRFIRKKKIVVRKA